MSLRSATSALTPPSLVGNDDTTAKPLQQPLVHLRQACIAQRLVQAGDTVRDLITLLRADMRHNDGLHGQLDLVDKQLRVMTEMVRRKDEADRRGIVLPVARATHPSAAGVAYTATPELAARAVSDDERASTNARGAIKRDRLLVSATLPPSHLLPELSAACVRDRGMTEPPMKTQKLAERDTFHSEAEVDDIIREATRKFRHTLCLRNGATTCNTRPLSDAVLLEAMQLPSLTEINLSDNGIRDCGAAVLGEALATNTSLLRLTLSNNHIRDRGATALGKALTSNASLWKLDLSSNSICDKGAKALGAALADNDDTELETLVLHYNSICYDGAAALVQVLEGSDLFIDLSDNPIAPENKQRLRSGLSVRADMSLRI